MVNVQRQVAMSTARATKAIFLLLIATVQVNAIHHATTKADIIEHVRSVASNDILQKCIDMVHGHSRWFSQAGQDWYLFHNYFGRSLDTVKHGFYLDIGSNHPLKISNTFFYDRCLGWKGICVEPNPEYHEFYKNRTCHLVKTCVDNKASHVSFQFDGTDGHINHEAGGNMQCTTLHTLLKDVPRVDFASIDIEGNEEHVFRCLNMTDLDIRVWLVETNKINAATFDMPFFRNGYYKATQILNFNPVTKDEYGDLLDTVYVKRPRPEVLPRFAGQCREDDLKESRWCGTIMPRYTDDERVCGFG